MNQADFFISELDKHIDGERENYHRFLDQHKFSIPFFDAFMVMLNSHIHEQKKIQLAIGFNWILQEYLAAKYPLTQIWMILMNGLFKNNTLSWTCYFTLGKSCQIVVQKLQQYLPQQMGRHYGDFSLSFKIVLQRAVVDQQTVGINNKYRSKFIKETIQNFIQNGFFYLEDLFVQQNYGEIYDEIKRKCVAYCLALKQTLSYLSRNGVQGNRQQNILRNLTLNSVLIKIIKKLLNLGSDDNDYCLLMKMGQIQVIEQINDLKALAIKMLAILAEEHSKSSTVSQFDEYESLSLMESLLPKIINILSNKPLKELDLICNRQACMNFLLLLSKSVEFSFLNPYFSQHQDVIIWKIILPLLQKSDEDQRLFQNDPDEFISHYERNVSDIEYGEQSFKTIKTYASMFMQNFVRNIEETLPTIINISCDIINHILVGHIEPIHERCLYFGYNPQIQTSFMIFSILFIQIKKTKNLFQKVSSIFAEEHVLMVKGFDCAIMLLYLSYNYKEIFENRLNGHKYLVLANKSLQQGETLARCALQLFEECREMEFSEQIWSRLTHLMLETRCVDYIKLIGKILQKSLKKIRNKEIILLVETLVMKIKKQFDQKQGSYAHIENDYVNKCLICLKIITQDPEYLKENSEIAEKVWSLFDFLKIINQIEYDDGIIQIFTNVIYSVDELNQPFYQFLPHFRNSHDKSMAVGELYQTYLLLVERGSDYLANDGQRYLQQIIQNLQYVLQYSSNEGLRQVCLLLQFVLTVFPNMIPHLDLFNITRQKLIEFPNKYDEDTVAILMNYWLMGSIVDDCYQIRNLLAKDPSIFNEYHSKILAYSLNLKMVMEAQRKQIHQVQFYFIFGLDLLLYLRTKGKKVRSNYENLIEIDKFQTINPFDEIRKGFDQVKFLLSREEMDIMMDRVDRVIPISQVNSLLSVVQVNKDPRTIIKIKRFN